MEHKEYKAINKSVRKKDSRKKLLISSLLSLTRALISVASAIPALS